MADLSKRRLRLIVATILVFVAISLAGALSGTAATALIAVAFALAMTDRIKKLK